MPQTRKRRRGVVKGTWKHKEREFARLFGSERRALSGGNSKSGGRDDAHHEHLYLECKYSARHKLWALWRHVAACAARETRIPKRRVCIGLYETKMPGALLVMHESDLLGVAVELLAELMKTKDYPYSRYESEQLLHKFRVLAKLPVPVYEGY